MSSQASSSSSSEYTPSESRSLSIATLAQFNDMLPEIHLGALATALILVSSRSNSLSPNTSPPPTSSPSISLGSSVSNTSRSSSKRYRKRTCFAFNHMPNDDLNTKYYHLTTKVLEWRYQYYN